MHGFSSTSRRWTVRLLVVVQTMLLVASLFAPIPVAAADPADPDATPSPTETAATPEPDPTAAPDPTATPDPRPTAVPDATAAPDPTATPDATAAAGPDPTPQADPTATPAADPTGAPSIAPNADPSPTSNPAPGPTSSYIVAFVAGTSSSARADALAAAGADVVDSIAQLRMAVIAVPAGSSVVADLRADPSVASVEADRVRDAEALPNDTRAADQWALDTIGWTSVYGSVSPSGSAVVAVLDTGVDASTPDLADQLVAGTSILDGSAGTTDANGHGTWMAGIIAAATDNGIGVAGVGYAGVRVMPVTVLGADGLGQDSDIIEGVVWAVQHGADVINMSFSNPGYSSALQAAIDFAWDHDVVVVAATGNDGSSSGTFPAGDRGVIGVSATDRSDTLASSSNHGPDVFLAAPGVDILTTAPGGGSTAISGTSASSAIVAAAAGLLRAADPSASNGVIVGRLARNADPAGSIADTGNGRVNLARALSDTSSDGVQPHGAAPVGNGGPIVGPYVAAAVQLQGVAAPAPANEGNGSSHTITFTIHMGGSGAAIPIWWRTQGGTATGGAACGAGVDYITIPSTTASQGDTDLNVSVTICEDMVVEPNETVTLQAADNAAFNNGGGDKMASSTATILNDDVATNQPPTATNLSAAETYVEDTTLNLVNIVASDVDSATVTATLTLSNTAAGSLTTGTSGAVTSTYVPGTGVWTASGAITDVNTLLTGVSFVPALNFNANFTIATSVSDGALSVTGSKAVTGTPVNDAPTATNLSAAETYVEDTTLNLVNIVASDVDSATVTATLTLSNTAAGSLTTGTSGAVTSTYVPGTGVWTASGAITDVNTLLAGVSFVPALNFNANFTIATSVSDGALSVTGSKAVTGTPVNDAPTATNLSAAETYVEDTTLNLVNIVASDVDSATVTATLTLSNTAAGSLTTGTSGAVTSTYVPGTGVWTASGAITDVNTLLTGVSFVPALNFNANFTIATSVSDGALSVTGSKAVTGTPVNDAPVVVIIGTFSPVDEGTSRTYTYTVTDVDSASPTVTESCTGDAVYVTDVVANSFACTFVDGLGSATVNVTADDHAVDNNIGDDPHGVTVNNVAPVVSPPAVDAPENQDAPEGSAHAFAIGSFVDAGSNDGPWAVEVDWGDGTTNSTFNQATQGSLGTFSHSFADDGVYSVSVYVTDKDTASGHATFSVTVTNVAPTAAFGNDGPVNEGTSFHLALTLPFDPSPVDTTAGFTYAFDCGSGYGSFSATASATCPTSDNGVRSVGAKIRDKDGGTSTYTTTVTVNNVAPTIAISGAASVNEGFAYSLTLGAVTDPGTDTVSNYHVDWGDGSFTNYTTNGVVTHTYADGPNTWPITVDLTDEDDTFLDVGDPLSVTVNNVAPTIAISGLASVNEGSLYSLTLGAVTDPGTDTVSSYVVHWGDGMTGTYSTAGVVTHTYADGPNTWAITVDLTDEDDTFLDVGDPLSVTVNNVAPTAAFGNDGPVNEGTSFHLALTLPFDPSPVDTTAGFTYAFDCGSGYGSFSATASATCPTSDNGVRSVGAKIRDKDGGTSTYTTTVTVNNVAPTGSFGNNGPVNEGSPATVTFTAQSDPSSVDTTAGFHYAYACDNASLSAAAYATSGTSASTTCTYPDGPSSQVVRARIIDKDGGYTEYATMVTVNNVAPTIAISGLASVDEGSAYSLTLGAVSDPGTDTVSSYVVHWGDGSSDTYGTAGAKTHTYADGPSTRAITVDLTDDDDTFLNAGNAFSVTVNNVAPTVGTVAVTFDPITHVATATASFTDPGKLDTHSATVTWNVAGTGPIVTRTESMGNGGVTGTITLPAGCYPTLTATIAVTDKDTGVGSKTGSLIGSADAYAASFQAPIQDNERNIAKYGNVVPIKVSLLSSCTGAAITTASLYITLTQGLNGEFIDDTNIVAESVSSADTGNLMRLNGSGYIFNLTTKGLTQGTDYAVRIRTGSSTGPIILQAILQPKK